MMFKPMKCCEKPFSIETEWRGIYLYIICSHCMTRVRTVGYLFIYDKESGDDLPE